MCKLVLQERGHTNANYGTAGLDKGCSLQIRRKEPLSELYRTLMPDP